MPKKKENKTNKRMNLFNLKPDEVDTVMKSRIAQFSPKGGNFSSKTTKWTEEELALRDSVIMSYITENCCSRERTAQQIAERWDVAIGTARRYVTEAVKRFAEHFTENSFEHLKKVFEERCEAIMQEALESGQKQEALKALDMLGKSVGVYTEKKDVNLSGDIDINFDFN